MTEVFIVYYSVDYEGEEVIGVFKTFGSAVIRLDEQRNAFGNADLWKKIYGGYPQHYRLDDRELYIKEFPLYE